MPRPEVADPRSAERPAEPQFDYVEEFVRYQLSKSLGGPRGMLESALPFIAFTVVWVVSRDRTGLPLSPLYLSLGAALATAVVLGLIRLVQRQSVRFVLQAIFPTAIAAIIAARTGRAEDVFLPGILYNGFLALISAFTIAIRKPLVGFIIGAAIGDPTGWMSDRGLVKMTSKLTAVLAVPYVTRFVIQLPLFLTGHIVLLGVAKVVLGWPLLLAALFVIGLMLSKGRTPMEGSSLTSRSNPVAAPESGHDPQP
ncbi:DUF3159 domain-containing protein [Microlunatus ginsengisoli]|uniref:DUF3159 domain-containing protein n=2 Tax=Microlunatus ginsengisoli TaxID=363863 RepID=A0ABP6ZKP0_9ACTN